MEAYLYGCRGLSCFVEANDLGLAFATKGFGKVSSEVAQDGRTGISDGFE